jgi:hypothetical protein
MIFDNDKFTDALEKCTRPLSDDEKKEACRNFRIFINCLADMMKENKTDESDNPGASIQPRTRGRTLPECSSWQTYRICE